MAVRIPFAPGGRSSNSAHAKDLGRIYWYNGKQWRLVKATAAFTTAQVRKLCLLDSGTGDLDNLTAATTSAASARVLGIGHATQEALASGDYFLVQVSGDATVTSGGVTIGTMVTSGTGGKPIDAAAATVTAIATYIGRARATAADTVETTIALALLV